VSRQADRVALDSVRRVADPVIENVGRAIRDKEEEVRLCLITLLCQGHLLIEDVPGVGKTMLAKALARSLDASFRRIQFTPDLLPSDITGVRAFNQKINEFEFRPGPVFAQVLLADEINRTPPKTQAALLQAMQEHRVTAGGRTYPLEEPFLVFAKRTDRVGHHRGQIGFPGGAASLPRAPPRRPRPTARHAHAHSDHVGPVHDRRHRQHRRDH